MIDVKIDKKDFDKLVEKLKAERHIMYLSFEVSGPKLNVSFIDSAGQLVTVHLFDHAVSTMPTITKTDRL